MATTSSRVRRAKSVTAWSISARSVRSRAKVTTWLRERGTHGAALTSVSPPPLASSNSHRPVRGPNVDVSSSASVRASCPTVVISRAASFFAVFGPTPQSASTGRSAITDIQFASVRAKTPAGFAKPVATLARCLLSLMPTEQDSPVSDRTMVRICSATSVGSASPGWQPEVRLVPAPHLDGMSQVAQQAHHLVGRRVVGGRIRRQEGGPRVWGTAAGGAAQRHARVHAELAGLIRGAGDDLARFGRIAVAADDDRQPDQFGVAAQFDRRQKLVEVDVQDPARRRLDHHGDHRPHSLRARLSHASPKVCRVCPPTLS